MPKYLIKFKDGGYYGSIPWTSCPRDKAIEFETMKAARRQLNRLNGRLWKEGNAEIELIK